jgi:hypothetical protein
MPGENNVNEVTNETSEVTDSKKRAAGGKN